MAETRRPAEESRALLIEAAAEVIRTEGYAALTARHLAEKVGLKRQIIHYYFRTTEELLVNVVRYFGDLGLTHFDQMLGEDPLRAMWEVQADSSATTFAFLSMAGHLPLVKAEMKHYMDEFRRRQAEAIAAYFEARGIKPAIPPVAMAIVIQGVSQAMAAESTIGANRGHEETRAVMEEVLHRLGTRGSLDPEDVR